MGRTYTPLGALPFVKAEEACREGRKEQVRNWECLCVQVHVCARVSVCPCVCLHVHVCVCVMRNLPM